MASHSSRVLPPVFACTSLTAASVASNSALSVAKPASNAVIVVATIVFLDVNCVTLSSVVFVAATAKPSATYAFFADSNRNAAVAV